MKKSFKLTTKFMLGIGIILLCAAGVASVVFYEYMKNLYIKEAYEKTDLVDDGYKINVSTSAWFKVFSQRLTYIFRSESLNLGIIFSSMQRRRCPMAGLWVSVLKM